MWEIIIANYSMTNNVNKTTSHNLKRNIENIINYSVAIIVKERNRKYTLSKETKLNSQ